jgi:hypothetical protein
MRAVGLLPLTLLPAAGSVAHADDTLRPTSVSEATLSRARKWNVITLANWSGREIADLRLTIRTATRYRRAESLTHGPLELTRGPVAVSLPIDSTDVVVLTK